MLYNALHFLVLMLGLALMQIGGMSFMSTIGVIIVIATDILYHEIKEHP
jgi:hypothetical protein